MKKPNDIKRKNNNSGSLGQFLRSRGVMLHKSCDVAMLPDPWNPEGPRVNPWVGKGETYNVGRNADKRKAREKFRYVRIVSPGANPVLQVRAPAFAI